MMTVDILLATYNGAAYLPEQLASLKAQTYPHWRLLIRDDGSQDATNAILSDFQHLHPDKVKILPAGVSSGAAANFAVLLASSEASYVMCCDQDDVWDKDKIAVSLQAMHTLEEVKGRDIPLLIHTDLRVADANLELLASSFWTYAKLYPSKTKTLGRLLVQNVVTGCTVMINRHLLQAALPIPAEAIMHDWWLALVASALGSLGIVERTTTTYRQHQSNALGAQKFGSKRHFQRFRQQLQQLTAQKHAQATAFLERYHSLLTCQILKTLEVYLSLPSRNSFVARYLALRYGLRKQGVLRQLVAFILMQQP